MPYIKQDTRKLLKVPGVKPMCAGDLNYKIHDLLNDYLFLKQESYQTYNDIIGVLECVKQEVYRRRIAPYEEIKLTQNGEVDFYK